MNKREFIKSVKLLLPETFCAREARLAVALALGAILFPVAPGARAQGGSLGSGSSPVINVQGRPMAGVSIAICQPMQVTAAQVTSTVATLTTAGNPIAAGFAAGMQIMVAGFSGSDTYFNGGTFAEQTGIAGGFTILAVTPTTITYSLTNANASASTTGTVLQMGNSTTPCAGLSTVYSDPANSQAITQPLSSDAFGNWSAFTSTSGLYFVQFYGPTVGTSMRRYVSLSPSNINNTIFVDGVTYKTVAAAVAAACALTPPGRVMIPPGTYNENPPALCNNLEISGASSNGPATVSGTKINTSITSGNFFDFPGELDVHFHDIWLHNTSVGATTARAIALHWGQGILGERFFVDGNWNAGLVLNPVATVGSTISNHFRNFQINVSGTNSTGCLFDALASTDKVVNANILENGICNGTLYAFRAQGGGGGGNTFINENQLINVQLYTGGTGTGASFAASSVSDMLLSTPTIENNATGISSVSGNSISCILCDISSNTTNISDPNTNINFFNGRGPQLGIQNFGVDQNGNVKVYGLCFASNSCSQNAINGPTGWSVQANGTTSYTVNPGWIGMKGFAASLATKSSTYTLTASDRWINVTGTTTITVPHAIVGQSWVVFNSGSNTVTIQADSGNINGGASVTRAANTGYEITCDGTNCFAH